MKTMLVVIILLGVGEDQCIEGWELIEGAQQKGEKSLTGEMIYVQQDSEVDVAIWKTSVRTMPI